MNLFGQKSNKRQKKIKDPLGYALLDYLDGKREEEVKVFSPDVEDDVIPVDYFFRSFDDMPEVEKEALKLVRGKTLDVGAGSGCHTIWLKENQADVVPVDSSPGCVEAMKRQNIDNARQADIWEMEDEQYDTILLLMNGMGFAGKIENMPQFLRQLKKLLKPGGQILFDSTDLIYLFLDDEGGAWIDLNDKYIGELTYTMEYKGIKSEPFPWLFVDFDLVKEAAEMVELQAEKILSTETYGYCARLTK